MSRLIRPLSGLLLSLVLVSTTQAAAPPARHVDRHGDPLPREAVTRLGSIRFRLGMGDVPVGLSPDGKRLFLAAQSGPLSVCDLATGKTRPVSLAGGDLGGNSQILALSPACDFAVVQTGDKLHGYDVRTDKKLWTFDGTSPPQIAFDPTGKHFGRFQADPNKPGEGVALIHRADNGKKTDSLDLKGQDVRLALLPGATRLLSWDNQAINPGMNRPFWEVVFHDVAKAKEIGRAPFYHGVPIVGVRPDGKEVAVASGTTVSLLDPTDAKKSRTLRASATVTALQYSPDGKYLATAGFRRADLWEVKTWKRLPTRQLPQNETSQLAFPAPGRLLVVSNWARDVVVTDAMTGKSTRSPSGHNGPVTALHFDGQNLRTAGSDGKVTTWDRSGRQLSQVTVFSESLFEQRGIALGGGVPLPGPADLGLSLGTRVEFSRSGRWVVSELGTVYDLKAGESRFDDLTAGGGGISSVCISRDDVLLVAGIDEDDPNGTGAKLSAIRLDNGEMLWSAKQPAQAGVGRVAVSPDGKVAAMMVLSGEQQTTVHLFDATIGKPLKGAKEYDAAGVPGQLLDFSSDGRMLVGAAMPGGLFFLDARTGAAVHSLKVEGTMTAVALCPLGHTVAVVLADENGTQSTIHLFEISSGKVRLKLSPCDHVTGLRFSPDGRHLASGHDGGTALLWDLEPEQKAGKGDWKRLSGDDAADAYRVTWQLGRDPSRAVELVKKHVKPSPPGPEAAELKKLLAGLDDEDVKVRDESEDALKEHGRAVELALRRALEQTDSTEVKRRVRRLLAALPNDFDTLTPALRGVELLERVGTKEAREALANLAKGNASSRLTQEAKAALARLTKRDE